MCTAEKAVLFLREFPYFILFGILKNREPKELGSLFFAQKENQKKEEKNMQKNKLKQAVMHAALAFTMAGTTLSPIIAQPVPVCASNLTITEAQSPTISKRQLTLRVGQKETLYASLPNK